MSTLRVGDLTLRDEVVKLLRDLREHPQGHVLRITLLRSVGWLSRRYRIASVVPLSGLCIAVAGVIGMPILRLVLRASSLPQRTGASGTSRSTRMSYPHTPAEDTYDVRVGRVCQTPKAAGYLMVPGATAAENVPFQSCTGAAALTAISSPSMPAPRS